ncbi:MAG TPA: T9SS type A sorting domain-containing protein, partial [Flavobacterium sp.]|nr:T9SS type A sorting domain-containing protein [Flavobacterium sp.]
INGTLWGWGMNSFGQLGDGTQVERTVPTLIAAAGIWQFISGGGAFTVGIKTDGTLWSWGNNAYGQLGDGTTTNKANPTQIGTAANWQKAAAIDAETIAVQGGVAYTWGDNQYGQLGNGTTVDSHLPLAISCFASAYNPTLNQPSWNITVAGFTGTQDYIISAVGQVTLDGNTYTEFADPYTNQNYLLREDIIQRSVYRRVNGTDELLYAFNIESGDEMTLENGMTYTATIDWVAVNGGMRKRISLFNMIAPTETWIEGVGSNKHPFLRNYQMPSDPYVYLTCSAQNNINVYNHNIANGQPVMSDCSMLKTTDFRIADQISIYPNPASSSVNITSAKIIQEISIISMLGKNMLSVKPNALTSKIEIGSLAKGVYLINITADNKTVTRKLIVQ